MRSVFVRFSSVFLTLCLCSVLTAHAATFKQVTVTDLWNESKLIFQGRVIAVEVRQGESRSHIYTYVRFQITRLVKGKHEASELELAFEGGSYKGLRLEVPGVIVPQLDEEVILFVENPDRLQINPVFGWSQGFFRVFTGPSGQKYVTTAAGYAVTALRPEPSSGGLLISQGIATGVISEIPEGQNNAMLVEEFVTRLRAIGEAGS